MFFKKKCPSCGAKNDKERMVCIECGAPMALEKAGRQVTDVSQATIEDVESTTLCGTCHKELDCLQRGIFRREICIQYEPLPTVEILENSMVKACPECCSENYHDCENSSLLDDYTVGHCLDCEAYWCLECGYIFEFVEEGIECPHWKICADCSDEHGYLDQTEFTEIICSTCEHYDNGCQLEDPLQCDARSQSLCPYDNAVSICPKIEDILKAVVEERTSITDSHEMESEYVKYIPSKCVYCDSSNVSEVLKRTIKGEFVNGYLWDIRCSNCGANWVALEKPDFQ